MIAAREEGKKRKKELMEVKTGKRRKKEVWCGNHGETAWGEAGSSSNGKSRRKFLYEREEGSLEARKGRVRLKQKMIIPLTENEMMTRQYLIELANNFNFVKQN